MHSRFYTLCITFTVQWAIQFPFLLNSRTSCARVRYLIFHHYIGYSFKSLICKAITRKLQDLYFRGNSHHLTISSTFTVNSCFSHFTRLVIGNLQFFKFRTFKGVTAGFVKLVQFQSVYVYSQLVSRTRMRTHVHACMRVYVYARKDCSKIVDHSVEPFRLLFSDR